MFQIFDFILNQPLGLLMRFFYGLFNNYALAILFFAIAVKIILLPLGIKQQNGQIKMAKIKPKEQAIRGKYAGRTDSATQQKMQSEVLDMYKKENYSPMSGCLPLLVQMPILFALYNIIRNPLTYIAQLSGDMVDGIKNFIFENSETFYGVIKNLGKLNESGEYVRTISDAKNIQQIDIVKVFNNPELFGEIRAAIVGQFPDFANFRNLNFGFLGQMLTSAPADAILSILVLIPILNFAASFLQMRLQKIINKNTAAGEMANNKGMKMMEYTMPLLIVWMSYQMYAALGLYWIFQSVLGILQMIALSKLYPIPQISEEEYELARIEYGAAKKKKKKKSADEIGEAGETYLIEEPGTGESDTGVNEKEEEEEKYISKTIPEGISRNLKSNYQKTGKKYKIKKKK